MRPKSFVPEWYHVVPEAAFADDSATLVEWLGRHLPDIRVVIELDSRDPLTRAHPGLAPQPGDVRDAYTLRLMVRTPERWELWPNGGGPWEGPWQRMTAEARRATLYRMTLGTHVRAPDSVHAVDEAGMAVAAATREAELWQTNGTTHLWDAPGLEILVALLDHFGAEVEEQAWFLLSFTEHGPLARDLVDRYRRWVARIPYAPEVAAVLDAAMREFTKDDLRDVDRALIRRLALPAVVDQPREVWPDFARQELRRLVERYRRDPD